MASQPIRPPHEEALNVTPLNSMPYIDPLVSRGLCNSFPAQGDKEPVQTAKPALIYLPSQPTEVEWNNVLSATNAGIGLSGSAAAGTIGPVLGKMDIGESEDSYIFRVSLPGVAKEDFTCDVAHSGKILINGVTTTGEKIVYKNSLKFVMQSQHLCPPGHFSISFNLPGPVDSEQLRACFGNDGVFEGIVKKQISAI